MKKLIFIIFIIIPIIEIAIFVEFSDTFGIWTTITFIVLTAIFGGKLFRSQGLRTLRSALASTEKNIFPTQEVFVGACILLAGLLLITPGFLTDILGFALFVPLCRHHLGFLILRFLKGRSDCFYHSNVTNDMTNKTQSRKIIETNYQEIIDEDHRGNN